MFEQIDTIAALRERLARRSTPPEGGVHATELAAPKPEGRRRGLVPTMGALHAGHAELIGAARRECDVVVVSIFVNPLQFDSPDDLTRYPRTLEADIALCREAGVDVVFTPLPAEMYPEKPECTIDVGRLGDHLCGKFRTGHFRGVATVVLKLLEIVQPDRAYFGEKDAQQLAIVKRMTSDLNVPVTIVGVPTVREGDGLALSSRNRHLGAEERGLAGALYQTLVEARRLLADGERNAASVRSAAAEKIPHSKLLRLEYLEVVDAATLQPVERVAGSIRIAGAMWVGSTRLIDNLEWHAPPEPGPSA